MFRKAKIGVVPENTPPANIKALFEARDYVQGGENFQINNFINSDAREVLTELDRKYKKSSNLIALLSTAQSGVFDFLSEVLSICRIKIFYLRLRNFAGNRGHFDYNSIRSLSNAVINCGSIDTLSLLEVNGIRNFKDTFLRPIFKAHLNMKLHLQPEVTDSKQNVRLLKMLATSQAFRRMDLDRYFTAKEFLLAGEDVARKLVNITRNLVVYLDLNPLKLEFLDIFRNIDLNWTIADDNPEVNTKRVYSYIEKHKFRNPTIHLGNQSYEAHKPIARLLRKIKSKSRVPVRKA